VEMMHHVQPPEGQSEAHRRLGVTHVTQHDRNLAARGRRVAARIRQSWRCRLSIPARPDSAHRCPDRRGSPPRARPYATSLAFLRLRPRVPARPIVEARPQAWPEVARCDLRLRHRRLFRKGANDAPNVKDYIAHEWTASLL
jgi:hypothetical protein